MPEPIYDFVPGQGWIISNPYVAKMRCGKRVMLEFRKPVIGERYDYTDCGSRAGYPDSPNIEFWKSNFKRFDFENLCGPRETNNEYASGCIYVVVVPL